MTKSQSHAKRELELLEKTIPDALIMPFKKEILALCEAFGNSGQSGGSAPCTASAISQAIEKLLMRETIVPLTGDDSEWVDMTGFYDGEIMFQNNRDSRIFKDGKDEKAYFIDAVVFDGDIEGRFTSHGVVKHNGEKIGSTQYIKEFPFTPKTFYVDVFNHRWADEEGKVPDENGDWWTHSLKDEKQLDDVFEYYDRMTS